MTTYNHSSSYNRSYERKVTEEGSPSIRIHSSSSPLQTIKSTLGGFPNGPNSSFMNPHNYHFGTATSGSFHSSDDSFNAILDVSAFAAEDLKVSVAGQYIVIEGKHPEKADDLGFIERHFIRKFALPRNAHPDTVTSNLTSDGQLSITAQAPLVKENSPLRNIPIKIVSSPITKSEEPSKPT